MKRWDLVKDKVEDDASAYRATYHHHDSFSEMYITGSLEDAVSWIQERMDKELANART